MSLFRFFLVFIIFLSLSSDLFDSTSPDLPAQDAPFALVPPDAVLGMDFKSMIFSIFAFCFYFLIEFALFVHRSANILTCF